MASYDGCNGCYPVPGNSLGSYMTPNAQTLTLVSGTPYTFTFSCCHPWDNFTGLFVLTFTLEVTSPRNTKVETASETFGIVLGNY